MRTHETGAVDRGLDEASQVLLILTIAMNIAGLSVLASQIFYMHQALAKDGTGAMFDGFVKATKGSRWYALHSIIMSMPLMMLLIGLVFYRQTAPWSSGRLASGGRGPGRRRWRPPVHPRGRSGHPGAVGRGGAAGAEEPPGVCAAARRQQEGVGLRPAVECGPARRPRRAPTPPDAGRPRGNRVHPFFLHPSMEAELLLPASPNWFCTGVACAHPSGDVLAYCAGSRVVLANRAHGASFCAARHIAAHKPGSRANAAVFLPCEEGEGSLLASGGSDGLVAVWDVVAAEKVYHHRAHKTGVTALARAGRAVVSGDERGLVIAWTPGQAAHVALALGGPRVRPVRRRRPALGIG